MIKLNKDLLNKIKLVVFDLDGTILDLNNNLSESTISLVKQLKKKGLKFTIASARHISSFTNHIESLEIEDPVISLDGLMISNPFQHKIIYHSTLPAKYVKKAIDLSEKYSVYMAICCGEAICYNQNDSLLLSYLSRYGTRLKLIDSYQSYLDNIYEIVMVSDVFEHIKKIKSKMIFPYTFGVHAAYYRSISNGGVYFLELRKMSNDKGKALKKLCSYMDIDLKETAVIGDWYNDIPLFQLNALKIAMPNAVPEIKKLADVVLTKSNNEEGINDFLNLLIEIKS